MSPLGHFDRVTQLQSAEKGNHSNAKKWSFVYLPIGNTAVLVYHFLRSIRHWLKNKTMHDINPGRKQFQRIKANFKRMRHNCDNALPDASN